MKRLLSLLVLVLATLVLAEQTAQFGCGSNRVFPSGYCDDGKLEERIDALNEFLLNYLGRAWDSAAVEIAHDPQVGLGLVAREDIEAGKPIMFIDANIFGIKFITMDVVVQLGPFPSFSNFTDPIQPFALWVLRQYVPNTLWFPYLDAFPKDFSFMPHTWTDEQIDEIQLPHVAELIKTRKADIKLGYEYAVDALKLEKHSKSFRDGFEFTFERYQWAYLAMLTHMVRYGPRVDQVALVPGFDLFNHKAVPHAPYIHMPTPYNPEKGHLSVYARKPYKKGDPITILYPAHQVATLFEAYGIVPDEEETFTVMVQHDPLSIFYDVPNPSDFGATPEEIHAARNATGEMTKYPVHYDNLFVFIEVLRRLENRSETHNLDALQTLDLHMDEYVRVATQLKAAVKKYPTSLEHDKSSLAKAKAGSPEHSALKLRMAMKRMLQGGAVTFKKVRDTLDALFEKLKVKIAAQQDEDEEHETLKVQATTREEDGILRLAKKHPQPAAEAAAPAQEPKKPHIRTEL